MTTTRTLSMALACAMAAGAAFAQTPSQAPRQTQPTTPSTQPSGPSTQPALPPAGQPGASPVQPAPGLRTRGTDTTATQPVTGAGTGTTQQTQTTAAQRQARLFQLENQQSLGQLNEFGARVQRIESQLQASNQRLLRMLGQARQLQGDRRLDGFAEVLQGVLQEQANMNQYLVDLRTAMTGDLAAASGTNPTGTNGTTVPNPNQVPRLNPASPVTNPHTAPQPGDVPQTPNTTVPDPNSVPRANPAEPTTNPATPPGTPR